MTDEPATTRAEARRERDEWLAERDEWHEGFHRTLAERDEALAQVVALRAENAEAWKLYTQATTDAYGVRVLIAVLHQPTDADECPVCMTEDGMSYASPCPTLRAVRAPGGTETGPVAVGSPETAANTSPDLLGPQIGAVELWDHVTSAPLDPDYWDTVHAHPVTESCPECEPADLRTRVEAVVAPWPPGVRKGDVLRALDGGR